MAANTANLGLIGSVNGFGLYRYDTTDAHADIDGAGYFNNVDDNLNLAVGDIIEVVVWTTAVRTGVPADVSRHIVYAVLTTGAVNLSTELVDMTLVSGD